MDMNLGNNLMKRKGLLKKTLERCKTFAAGMKNKGGSTSHILTRRSKSWPNRTSLSSSKEGNECNSINKRRVTPKGCLSVCVGPEKQRFVIKTAYVNHPLFKMLLEEAESEYVYNCEGPLVLPCEVSLFVKVLVEMDSKEESDEIQCAARYPCSPYHLLASPRSLAINQF